MGKRRAPAFNYNGLTDDERGFLAWVSAVDERGSARLGPTEMPQRGVSMPHDLLYDIIRAARLSYALIDTLDRVSEADRRDAEERIAEAASPVESAQRIIRTFEGLRPGAKMEILRNTRGFIVQGFAHGATISEALDNWLRDDRSRRAVK